MIRILTAPALLSGKVKKIGYDPTGYEKYFVVESYVPERGLIDVLYAHLQRDMLELINMLREGTQLE